MLQEINNPKLSPLFLEGWQEYNRIKWDVRPHKISFQADALKPSLEAIVYLNQKGKIFIPPLNPYIPINFKPTATILPSRIERQWHEMAELLIEEITSLEVADTFGLPPNITDVRPWQWAGYNVGVRYTYDIGFPYNLSHIDKSLRNSINKALKANFICEQTTKIDDVYCCLNDTAKRQNFSHKFTLQDLELARDLVGDNNFRAYVSYAPNGDAASSTIELHSAGSTAIGWVGGTKREYLSSGSYQLLTNYVLNDLEAAGAIGYDFVGANIPNVAYSKSIWGGKLVPYYTIGNYNSKQLARWLRNCYKFTFSGKGG